MPDEAARPLVVVVTGPPASGKSTVAEELARALGVPLVDKDTIKELLFDELGWSDREWSKQLGRASILLLHTIVERLVAGGASLVVEANFELLSAERLDALPARLLQVYCTAPADVLVRRFDERPRHPGHVDDSWDLGEELASGRWPQLPLEAPLVEYETERDDPDDAVAAVLAQLGIATHSSMS